ncbi:unnamed protein product [Peronospora farinosa]|uniref:Uncharacterized protein n=2 Tax=Peronospora farinosa TaxID=134698 RepID=A0AAV0SVZ8_9STRA|nr:unnamed protein product [Peronospora farinosa]
MLSSKCDIVTTFIGVINPGGLRFLGQAIIPMEPGWENKTKICAPLAKWKSPVNECVVRLNCFTKGTMELEIKPISSRMPKVSSNASSTSSALVTPKMTHRALCLAEDAGDAVRRSSVLVDTSSLLFDNMSAELLIFAKSSMYVLYVLSYAQQQLWEYKINLRRRVSLIP